MTESIERIDKKRCVRRCVHACYKRENKIYMIIEFFCHLSEKFCSHLYRNQSFDFNMRRSKCASFFLRRLLNRRL